MEEMEEWEGFKKGREGGSEEDEWQRQVESEEWLDWKREEMEEREEWEELKKEREEWG